VALLEDLGKAAATPETLVIGVGAALLAPVLGPTVASVLRPTAKALMRTGITLYRGAMEPLTAGFSNLVAEVRTELATASGEVSQTTAASDKQDQEDGSRSQRRQGGRSRS
jgi:hypothetical protein